MRVIDAHEDVAWNVLALGRDMQRSAQETRRIESGGPNPERNGQCMLGLPNWLEGGVAVVVGSIFLSPARKASHFSWDSQCYADAQEAYRAGMAQMDVYRRLAGESERIDLIEDRAGLEAVLASWEGDSPRVGFFVSLEGADPVRSPAEFEDWYALGVRGVGLAWALGSRYAGGNDAPGPLTDAGRALLDVMAEFGVLLDISHLDERACWEALDRYAGPVAATHANPRALVPTPRQLSDRMIAALAERDGVMGIVPFNKFLKPGWLRADGKAAVTLADVVAAIDHVCQVVGDAAHVGLGSDFDGGFGAEATPESIETVADLPKIAAALTAYGYTPSDVAGVMGENWLRVLRSALGG
ncbi:MAG: membrane dipeptidase [Anaerolineae bacterium]|nr:membrane dipeptidase [Anaerolineae bacterium]